MRRTTLFIYLINLLICLSFSDFIEAKIKSDTFKVTIKGRLIEVISPQDFSENLSVIVVNNESLTKIVLKAMKDTGKSLSLILEPNSFDQSKLNF